MKCELCKKKDASVHFKQIAEGSIKELYVCEDCAAANGFDVQTPMSLTNFLFGVGVEPAQKEPARKKELTCTHCGMASDDFRKHSRLGCPRCYDALSAELRPMISSMQKSGVHIGKIPASARVFTETSRLQARLKDAIAHQNYEEAAAIRDQIKALQSQVPLKQARPSFSATGTGEPLT